MENSPNPPDSLPVLIIGLGNPILGDDGVGWRVATEVQNFLANQKASFKETEWEIDHLCIGGLSLMERMVGYDVVILIDAIIAGSEPQGRITCLSLNDIPNRAWGHLTSSHDTTLHNALEIGREMGAHLPTKVWIVGIEARNVFEFSETLSPEVAAVVPEAVEKVVHLLTSSYEISLRKRY